MHPLAEKVQQALNALGYSGKVQELPASTRTALEAAQALNCEIGQIVKSLVFIFSGNHQPILLLVSGKNRVDEVKVGFVLGDEIRKATAQEVQQITGFPIGGVPPIGHLQILPVIFDEDLLHFEIVWAAAGTSNSIFPISPTLLRDITHARVMSVK